MKTTDLGAFNLTTQQVEQTAVKVSLTELDKELTENSVGKAMQLILRHFDSYGEGKTVKSAQERAIRRALARKEKLGEGRFRVDITNLSKVQAVLKDGEVEVVVRFDLLCVETFHRSSHEASGD